MPTSSKTHMHEYPIVMSHTAIGPCTAVCATRAWHGTMMPSVALLGQRLGSLKAAFSTAAPSRSIRCRLRPARPLAAFKGFGKAVEKKPSETKQCPCGSGQAYDDCCKVYHEGTLPETAEALMRSRYSAYAKGIVEYVVKTTHPDNPLKPGTPGSTLVDDVRATCDKIGWERLKVLEVEDGATPDEAFVTFQTWFKVRKQIGKRQKGWHTQTFVERSRFLKDETRGWLYVDGDQEWEPDKKESSVPIVKK